jgi:S1-C subfamily serine protease
LVFDDDTDPGDQGAVLGYPGNGPFAIAPARVRAEQRLQGPDIYGQRQVVRNVLSLYARVRPGNSGGPLVSPEGTVSGVVFAASVDDPRTGYALTVDEVRDVAQGGMTASEPVPTGACA